MSEYNILEQVSALSIVRLLVKKNVSVSVADVAVTLVVCQLEGYIA